MTELKQIVALTNNTSDNMSRHEMLDWVNRIVHGNYKKVEELCSGVAYCQMMELMFPNCIGLKKIKTAAKLDHEFLHNLKLFQFAFNRLKLDKTVPIDRLIKGRFQDNFEFLQWFKKFFDSMAGGRKDLMVPETQAATVVNTAKGICKNYVSETVSACGEPCKKAQSNESAPEGPESPSPFDEMEEEANYLSVKIQTIAKERDYFFSKLSDVENLVKMHSNKGEYTEFSSRIMEILYDDNSSESQEPKKSKDPEDNENFQDLEGLEEELRGSEELEQPIELKDPKLLEESDEDPAK